MMDDVAYKLQMDPVEFGLKNMARMFRDEVPFTNYSLDECIHRRKSRSLRLKRGGGRSRAQTWGPSSVARQFHLHDVPLGSWEQQRSHSGGRRRGIHVVCRRHGRRRWCQDDDGADRSGGARGSAVAGQGGVGRYGPLPALVGESGSRTTIATGYAVMEAVLSEEADRGEAGMPTGTQTLVATPRPILGLPTTKVRNAYGAHFVEVEVDTGSDTFA